MEPASTAFVVYRPDIRAGERQVFTAAVPTELDRKLTPAVDKYGVPKPPAQLLESFEALKLSLRIWSDVTAAHNTVRQNILEQLGRSTIPALGPKLKDLKSFVQQLEYTLKSLAITRQSEVGHRDAFYRAVAIASCGHTGKRTDSGAPLPLCEVYKSDGYGKGDGVVEALTLDDQLALSVIYYMFLEVDLERIVDRCPAIITQRPEVASLIKRLNDAFTLASRPFKPTIFNTHTRNVPKHRHRLADSLMGDAVLNGKTYVRVVTGECD
ncbi:uncharacterized protein LOC62_01G000141 [Vanrija pseudolonga]|uniref:Uncharacterized protein n=1 Tax=Vanrija pseudolonga TaxID=143232 RepID=A0AAF1BGN2_9TREE|nr:hypothetical protein LOC62_01G000141 [Vanrija pseudolonga]